MMRREYVAVAFVLLAILAVAGWMRHPEPVSAAPSIATQQMLNTPNAAMPNQDAAYLNGQPGAASNVNNGCAPASYNSNPVVSSVSYDDSRYAYASRRPIYVRPRPVQVVEPERVDRDEVVERRAVREYHTSRPRSTKKSVAIVAGTAGVGAAVGALAGGGKGAAIGALSGGGAGFLYDRLTHNRH